MPPVVPLPSTWPANPVALVEAGQDRMRQMCRLNGVPVPAVTVVARKDWLVGACAFYRPDTEGESKWRLPNHGKEVNICPSYCGRPCDDSPGRNWTWPASTTDREPFGVVLHELGHHFDWYCSDRKYDYCGDICERVHADAREPGLTSYADENPAEFLAEAFRLFAANPALLKALRPRTYSLLRERWVPAGDEDDWRTPLGDNVPDKIVRSLKNKGVR